MALNTEKYTETANNMEEEFNNIKKISSLKKVPYCHYFETSYGAINLSEEFGSFMKELHLEAMVMDHFSSDKKPVRFYEIGDAIEVLAGAALKSGVEVTNIFK